MIGFDIEMQPYPGQRVIQDVLTLHGSQFRDTTCIVASPPCQEFSYMAMPWKRAKQIERALRREDDFPDGYRGSITVTELTMLFDACFRIQREACEAASHHIPMVVENVCGAQKWVGRAKWHYGSYYLWGDVPALMPMTKRQVMKHGVTHRSDGSTHFHRGQYGLKVPGLKSGCFPPDGLAQGAINNGTKFGGGWWHDTENNLIRKASSKFNARKLTSAMIAKIPFPLARHVARCFKPKGERAGRACPAFRTGSEGPKER